MNVGYIRRVVRSRCERLKRSVSRYIRKATAAITLGFCASFVGTTLFNVTKRTALAFGKSRTGSLMAFPPKGWLIIAAIVLSALCYYVPRLSRFVTKTGRSWKAGLVDPMPLFAFMLSVAAGVGVQFQIAYPIPLLCGLLFVGLVLTDSRLEVARCKPKPRILGDPIRRPSQDILFRSQAVNSVLVKIEQGNPVVALVGDFGDGKSSVLNLLITKLAKQKDKYIPVVFNSWLPGSQEALVSSFLKSILDALKERFDLEGVEELVHSYARTLAGLIPRAGTGLLNLFKERSQAEEINNLILLTRGITERIVVLVDDLDRMQRSELEALLKLVRGVPEFYQITYVCAFSKEAIVRQLSTHSEDRSYYYKFVEKFFPVQVELSKIDSNVLSLQFDKRFESLCTRFGLLMSEDAQSRFATDFYPIWARYGRRFLTNLRRLNLYFENVGNLFASAGKEINIFDAMLLELLKEVHPEIVEMIYRHSYHFYQSEWRWETSIEVRLDEDRGKRERESFIKQLIEEVPNTDREIITGLLKELFPAVEESLSGHKRVGALGRLEAEKQRKIYHPVCFPCYFIHRTPLDKFGVTEFDRFRSLINSESQEDLIQSRFYATFSGLTFEPKRLDFLKWLLSSVEELGPIQSVSLAKAIWRIAFRFNPTEIAGEFGTARNFTLAAARRLSAKDGNVFLRTAISSSASDAFAADILIHSIEPDRSVIKPGWEIDKKELRETFRKRLKHRYLDQGGSLFVLDRYSALHILYRWRQCSEEAAKEQEKYLDKEFETAPNNIAKFLLWTWSDFPGGPDEFVNLKQLYTVDRVKCLLSINKDIAGESPEEIRTLEQFRTAYVEHAATGSSSDQKRKTVEAPNVLMDWESVDLRVELNQAHSVTMMILVRNLSDEELNIRRITLRSNRIDLGNPLSPNSEKPWLLTSKGSLHLDLNIGSSLKHSLITANGGNYVINERYNLDFCFLCEAKGTTKELIKTIRVQTDAHNDAVQHLT
ncbi:MAG TPA: P-loop NTPase fold protein [Candidatus Angelobacter sp.]